MVYNKINKQSFRGQRLNNRHDHENEDAAEQQARDLIQRMKDALEIDREANEKRKPAIQRMILSQELFREVKKIQVQEKFLDYGGCEALG